MNLTDIKVYLLGTVGMYLELGEFNGYVATLTGVVILGYTLSKWYFLMKGKDEE